MHFDLSGGSLRDNHRGWPLFYSLLGLRPASLMEFVKGFKEIDSFFFFFSYWIKAFKEISARSLTGHRNSGIENLVTTHNKEYYFWKIKKVWESIQTNDNCSPQQIITVILKGKKNLISTVTALQYPKCLMHNKKITKHIKEEKNMAHSLGKKRNWQKPSLRKPGYWTY